MEAHKFKKGEILSGSAKLVIFNILCFLHSSENHNITTAVKKTSLMTGVSERTVYNIKQEKGETGQLKTPTKRKKRVSQSNSREYTYDEGLKSTLRRIVHCEFFMKNLPPYLSRVYNFIKNDENIPSFSLSTLYRLLRDIGFVYQKRGRRSIMLEREDIVHWRHKYLRTIRRYRKENCNIIYLDESWVNVGQSVNFEWCDSTVKNSRDAFLKGLSTGLKAPTQRGPRYVLLHAGYEGGFITGAKRIFLAKKGDGDFHAEMDGTYFEDWFMESLIPNLPKNGRRNVVVMDNASYHSCKDRFPNSSWNKEEMKEWLRENDIFFEDNYLKSELLEVARSFKDKYDKHRLDEMAAQHNVTILRLPPYHCELNPIEMVWNQVKRHVATHNTNFKQVDVRNLIEEAFERVTEENWRNYTTHVIQKTEHQMWTADNIQDNVEELIIAVNTGDSTDSETELLDLDETLEVDGD